MLALLFYPFFAVLHLSTVLVALITYRAFYVDASSVWAFLATLDTGHVGSFTLEDFKAPVMLGAVASAYFGARTYFKLYVEHQPGFFGVFRIWLHVLVHDYFLIGSSIALVYILDALIPGYTALETSERAGALVMFWLVMGVVMEAIASFWDFLHPSGETERGLFVLPLPAVLKRRR